MRNLFKWIFLTVMIGIIGGIITSLFAHAIALATAFFTYVSWAVFLMPLAGILITALYSYFDERNLRGTDFVIESIRKGWEVPISMAPVSFAATILSHMAGASTGRIGTSLQLGASFSYLFAQKLHLSRTETKICLRIGMSAAFAPLFGTPLAAAFFALEVPVAGAWHIPSVLPCFGASMISMATSYICRISPLRLNMGTVLPFNIKSAAETALIGVFAALAGILLCEGLKYGKRLCRGIFPNPYLRIVAVCIPLIILSLIFPGGEYNGSGLPLIRKCFSASLIPCYAFLIKILFTVISVSAGFKGGEIGPAMCVGATLGAAAGALLNLPQGLCAALGLSGVFCAVTNCPFAAAALAFEIFGFQAVPLILICVIISFLLSGRCSLYETQIYAWFH